LSPSSAEGLSGLAQTDSAMGRTDEAVRILKQVVSSDPRRRDDLMLLGDIAIRSADYAGALDWLGRAERLGPEARSELLMAICYQHLNQLFDADRYLEMARRRAPENPEVQRSLAGYYRETGNYSQAIEALKSIHNPRPDVTAELAYTYQLEGKLDESATVYAQAANAAPKDLGLQLSAAQAEVAAGSIDTANLFLDHASRIDANSYRLQAIRGEIAKSEEHMQVAAREYTGALAHLPLTPAEGPLFGIQLHMDLMDVYKILGDED